MSTPPLPPPTNPRNLKELARALGFSAPALSQWRTKYPDDAPQGFEVAEWQAFIKRHELGQVGNRVSGSREELLRAKLAEEIKQLRIKNAQAVRELIAQKDVDAFLLYVGARLKSALYQMTSELPPKLAGQEAPDIRRMMREHADIVCLAMQAMHDEWRKEQEEAAAAAREAAQAQEAET